jgi:serine O-acetyltransferase
MIKTKEAAKLETIQSKADYQIFVDSDLRSLNLHNKRNWFMLNEVMTFQVRLRRLEFAINCKKSPLRILLRRYLYRRISIKLGISISPNTFGPGLSIAHHGTIVVNGGARIGANCRIHTGVNIGTEAGKDNAAPFIGDNCYIGPGAKIFGPIEIASNSVIGANAVVNKSFLDSGVTIAGVPAKVISRKSSEGYLIKGYPSY